MSDANDIQPTPEDNVQDLLKQLFRQMEIQQAEIRQLKAERADNPGTSPGRVEFRQTRPTTLKLYDELLRYYPAIDTPDFYSAELPKNHSVFDWSEFHYTEGMEYKAPPVLQHAEVSLSSSSKQHDQDLATIQGWMANTTRIFDSLAHELVEMQAGDTEIGERVFECLNIVRTSVANDAARISRMRSDIYYTAMGIKGGASKDNSILSLEDVASKRAASDLIKKAYKKPDPSKDKRKRFNVAAWRDNVRTDENKDSKSNKSGGSGNKSDSASSRYRRPYKPSNKRRSDSRSRHNKQQSDTGNDGEKSE